MLLIIISILLLMYFQERLTVRIQLPALDLVIRVFDQEKAISTSYIAHRLFASGRVGREILSEGNEIHISLAVLSGLHANTKTVLVNYQF